MKLHHLMLLGTVCVLLSSCGILSSNDDGVGTFCPLSYTPAITVAVTLGSGFYNNEVQVTVTNNGSVVSDVSNHESYPPQSTISPMMFSGGNSAGNYQVTVTYPGLAPKVYSNLQVTQTGTPGCPGLSGQTVNVSLP